MAIACDLPNCEEDNKMLDAAARGENNIISPEVKEAMERFEKETKPGLDRAEARWEVAESLGIEMENILEPATACGDTRELIANADPNTVIISYEDKVPIFATDFKDTGQEVSKSIKDYPKDLPEVKVYTPVLPTKENLARMLNGENPKSPWGVKVNLHHYEQDPKGPLMMMEQTQHQQFSGVIHEKGKSLLPEERDRYKRVERSNIWKMAAEAYLSDLIEDFKDAIKEKEGEKNG